jgi:hypothetical protein
MDVSPYKTDTMWHTVAYIPRKPQPTSVRPFLGSFHFMAKGQFFRAISAEPSPKIKPVISEIPSYWAILPRQAMGNCFNFRPISI